jgi:hypothetical protein
MFPRQQWWDTLWWKMDTKIGRVNHAARMASVQWFRYIKGGRRSGIVSPGMFNLAVYDRVEQL